MWLINGIFSHSVHVLKVGHSVGEETIQTQKCSIAVRVRTHHCRQGSPHSPIHQLQWSCGAMQATEDAVSEKCSMLRIEERPLDPAARMLKFAPPPHRVQDVTLLDREQRMRCDARTRRGISCARTDWLRREMMEHPCACGSAWADRRRGVSKKIIRSRPLKDERPQGANPQAARDRVPLLLPRAAARCTFARYLADLRSTRRLVECDPNLVRTTASNVTSC
eukprot:CAMPEP_0175931314 /NCGR_PEP_ID=MMETSP0108-20121206/18781_1 /TAXON_ID=195067 ORGANISM="Goniomonas pacifica, Strain CCMP1869" /NCGR_SAMPLE_ID=MMETSP0108 /ASSEMBLY_ACC=CAM_ASM_000204 /LENGTH=221 /DNA_ID=CAMNT_0017254859 /DNA_START=243 /DNA_END=909 /DNA_ORIENTATION=+